MEQLGITDRLGRFTLEEARRPTGTGLRTELWSVGNAEASPAVTYKIAGRSAKQGTVIATPAGKIRNRYGMAISALSARLGKVTTYAAVELTYNASLYYEARATSTIYQERKQVKTSDFSGGAHTSQLLEVLPIHMKTYLLLTKVYAVPFPAASGIYNPLKFAAGSCYGVNSDCQIVPLGGPARVSHSAIFLGTTAADQTYISHDPSYLAGQMSAEDQAGVLDALLSRAAGADDSFLVGVIHIIAGQHSFNRDVFIDKLKHVAARETPRVRQAACGVLKGLKEPCPRSERKKRGAFDPALPPKDPKQPVPNEKSVVNPDPLRFDALPKYLIYSHLLDMIHLIDQKNHRDSRSNGKDFDWPFLSETVSKGDLELLRNSANSLALQLRALDERARAVVSAFRQQATVELEQGKPMPPPPIEIFHLQALRTAVAVQHMVQLQSRLGSKQTMRLEGLLAYTFTRPGSLRDFTPEISATH